MADYLGKESLRAINTYFGNISYLAAYENGGYIATGRYFELFVLKSASDSSTGGSILVEAAFGDFTNQSYCQLQITTRGGLKVAGIKNGIYAGCSDLVISQSSDGLFHFYLYQLTDKWCDDLVIVKKAHSGIVNKVNKYLSIQSSSYSGTIKRRYSTDTKLTSISYGSYAARTTSIETSDLKNILIE